MDKTKKGAGVIYARYSSHNQKETSIEDQVRIDTLFAETQNIQVVGRYLDYESSGRTDNREEFKRLIEDAKKGLFQYVIVYKLDRFSRNRYDSAIYKAKLQKQGVKVLSATQSISEGPEGVILESVLEGMAEYYSLNLAQDIMRGKMREAAKCRHSGGRPLLGYKVLPDKSYAIDEEKAASVRLLFDMYASGSSYSQIIDELNRLGHRTAAGRTFGKNSLHELLRNERYIGVYTYNKSAKPTPDGKRNNHARKDESDIIRIENGIPAIIDMQTWERVKRRMEQNKKAPARYKANENYMLSGKIFCGECGGAMVGQPSHSKSGIYHYYTCNTKKRLRTCNKSNVKKETIESVVITKLRASLTDEMIDHIATLGVDVQLQNKDQKAEISRMQKQLAEIEKSLENIMHAIELGVFTASTKERIAELESEAEVLNQAIDLAKLSSEILFTKDGITEWLKTFQEEEQEQKLIDFLLKAVYVYEDRLIIFCNFSSDETNVDLKAFLDESSNMLDCADLEGCGLSAPSLDRLTEPIEGFFFVWKQCADLRLNLLISNIFLTRSFTLFFPGFF